MVSKKSDNPVGRPPKIKSPAHLQELFLDWKSKIESGEITDIPDVEAFCDFIGAWRDLLIDYEKKPEYSHSIKNIKNYIYYKKKQLAMQGKMNAAVFIFDAKNNAGYVEKQEIDNHHSGEVNFINDVPRPKR